MFQHDDHEGILPYEQTLSARKVWPFRSNCLFACTDRYLRILFCIDKISFYEYTECWNDLLI